MSVKKRFVDFAVRKRLSDRLVEALFIATTFVYVLIVVVPIALALLFVIVKFQSHPIIGVSLWLLFTLFWLIVCICGVRIIVPDRQNKSNVMYGRSDKIV